MRWPPARWCSARSWLSSARGRTRVVGLVLGFGAGALIASVSFELAEEGLSVGGAWWPVALGLALGGATFYLANRWVESVGSAPPRAVPPARPWPSAPSSTASPSRPSSGSASPRAGRQRRAPRRDLRLQPPGGDRFRRRHAVGGAQQGQVLGLWAPVAAACALATAGGYLAADAVSSTTSAVDRRFRRRRAAHDADRLDGPRGQGQGEGPGGPRHGGRVRPRGGTLAARISSRPPAAPSPRGRPAAAPAAGRRARGRGRTPSARSRPRRTSAR